MNTRVKRLRKEILKLNQTDFGKELGIGAQAVVEIEKGRNELTERNFDAICRTWNVNPEWLRHGVGEVFLPEELDTYLDKVVAEKKLLPEDRALIESIIEMPPEARKNVVDWAELLVAKLNRNDRRQTEQAKAEKRRALEKTIADAQQELAKLDGASCWVEESSIKAGGTFWHSVTENSA